MPTVRLGCQHGRLQAGRQGRARWHSVYPAFSPRRRVRSLKHASLADLASCSGCGRSAAPASSQPAASKGPHTVRH